MVSELQLYYDNFKTGYWADPDPSECLCNGGGWVSSEVDTWHKCPYHFKNQPHPEYDDPEPYGPPEVEVQYPTIIDDAAVARAKDDVDIPF